MQSGNMPLAPPGTQGDGPRGMPAPPPPPPGMNNMSGRGMPPPMGARPPRGPPPTGSFRSGPSMGMGGNYFPGGDDPNFNQGNYNEMPPNHNYGDRPPSSNYAPNNYNDMSQQNFGDMHPPNLMPPPPPPGMQGPPPGGFRHPPHFNDSDNSVKSYSGPPHWQNEDNHMSSDSGNFMDGKSENANKSSQHIGQSHNTSKTSGVKVSDILPQALEKVLAFKDFREKEIGEMEENEADTESKKKSSETVTSSSVQADPSIVSIDAKEDEKATRKRQDKNRKKREKKKRSKVRKNSKQEDDQKVNGYNSVGESEVDSATDKDDDVEIEYVQELPQELMDPSFRQFRKIFEHFKIADGGKSEVSGSSGNENASVNDSSTIKAPQNLSDLPMKARAALLVEESSKEFEEIFDDNDEKKMSKKKLKKLTRLSVSELKQLVARPDVVEMHDVCARDPRLLIHLKSYRNCVPVPRHWCAKRKYLQGKRGLEKPPFALPAYIQDTGIMEMRQAVQDKDADKSLKTKMRERIRPKVGKVDINYDKLHDAFFKHMIKPKLCIHGDLYYEGKEFEVKLKEKKPGILSDELRTALGMPIGSNCEKFPPPWLIAMQRYGPPPSYPNLRIPGLNAPIPDSCSFGYHAGGWGKPPVDETGRPLYGNVFGHSSEILDENLPDEAVAYDTQHWGELESDEESESEESSEEEEEEPRPDTSGLNTPAEGLITPSGTSSIGAGLDTPESIELRKRTLDETSSSVDMTGGLTPQLYHILPEMEASVGDAFLGSTKIYKTNLNSSTPAPGNTSRVPGDTSSVIAPSGVDSTLSGQQSTGWSSTMTGGKESTGGQASTTSQQQEKKAKKRAQEESQEGTTTAKSSKKYKDFKF